MIDWDKIKRKRNDLLTRSDWTQISDNQLTEAQKAEWRVYRQALRDLPQIYSSAEDKYDITWPTPP